MGKMRRLLAAVLVASMLFGTNGVSYAAETIADGASQETAVEETTEAVEEETESAAPAESDPSETVDAVAQTGAEDSSQDDSEAAEEVADKESDADDKAAAADNETDASETEKANDEAAVPETGDAGNAAETPEAGSSTEVAEEVPAEVTFSAGKLEYNGEDYGKDYSVTLSYDAKAEIPADAELQVTEIEKGTDEYEAYLKEANAAVENSVTDARFFDIKIMVGDEEIQPKSAVRVNISYKEAIEVEEKAEVQAVHFDEEKEETVPVEIENKKDINEAGEAGEVEFKADSFSVYAVLYTVDFNFTDHAFSIPGGSNILLSELAQKLGFYAESETKEFSVQDVAKVTFTNTELVKVEKQVGGDWLLTSLKAFSTKETLTIDMANGDQFVVDVTDAQGDALTVDVNLYDYNDSETKAFPDNFGGQDERLYAVVWAANRNSEGKLDSNIVNVNENGTPWAVVDITDNIRVNNGEPFDVASFFTSSHAQGDTAKSYANLTDDERDRLLVRVVHTDRAIDTLQKIQQWGKNGNPDERAAFEDMWNGGFDGYELSSHHASGPAGDDKYEVNFKEGNTLELDVTLKFDPAELEAIPGGKYYIKLDALSMDGSKHYYYFVEATADGNSDTVRLKVDGNWTEGQKYSKNWQSITPSVVFPAAGKTITEGGNLNEGMYLPATVIGNYTYEYEGRKTNIDTEEHVLHDEFTYKLTKTSFDDALTPDDILGDAVEFGIVADTYKQTGHSETNYAVKNLSHNANTDVCGSGTGAMPFYVSNVIEHTLDIELTSCPIDLFIPEDQDSKLAQPHINNLKNSTFTEPEAIAGEKKLTEYNLTHGEIEKYVQDMIDAGKKESEDLSEKSTVKPVLGQNEKTVDTTQFPDGKTIYVDCSDCKDTVAVDGWIIKKLPNQSIVFNIPGENVTIGQFTAYEYNESGTELRSVITETDAKDDGTSAKNRLVDSIIFDHISFNAYQAKTLQLTNTCALFLAPLAESVTQKNGAGWILAKGTVDSDSEWHFYRHNRHYTAKGDFELAGQKKIVDKDKQEQDYSKFSSMTFSFELYKCNEQGKVAEGAKPVQTLTAGKDGKFKFNKLKYTHTDVPEGGTKDFYYVIKEVIPKEDNDKGVTYDAADVYIKVAASDSSTGEISFVISKGSTFGDWTVVPNTGEGDNKVYEIGDFENTYEEQNGYLKIKKIVEGYSSSTKIYYIAVKNSEGHYFDELGNDLGTSETDAVYRQYIPNQEINWHLPIGKYTVIEKEDAAKVDGYNLTVTGTNVEVEVKAGTDNVTTNNVTNTYVEWAKEEIKAKKIFNNRTNWLSTDSFTFTLTAGTNTAGEGVVTPMPSGAQTAEDSSVFKETQVTSINEVSFGEITYKAEGVYTYTVSENIPADADKIKGVEYDENTYTVTVTVTKENGKLKATVAYPPEKTSVEITNTYTATGTATVEVGKRLVGKTLKDGDFTFTLAAVNPADAPMPATNIQTNTNGKATFADIPYTLDHAGKDYIYKVTETIDAAKTPNVKQDTVSGPSEIYAKITVGTDKGDGTLNESTVTYYKDAACKQLLSSATFINKYEASGEVQIKGNKKLEGGTLTEGQFTFKLQDTTGQDIKDSTGNPITASNKTNGTVTFPKITYTLSDMTYNAETNAYDDTEIEYQVVEDEGTDKTIIYDLAAKTVKVTLHDEGDGTITATAAPKDIQFTAENKVASVSESLKATKNYNNWEATPNLTFEFKLTPGTNTAEGGISTPMPAGTTGGAVTKNATKGDPTVDFGSIKFTAPGTYYYTIQETDGKVPGVTYDLAAHSVVVIVTRDEDTNALTAEVKYDNNSSLTISNNYATAKANIQVTKNYEGDSDWGKAQSFEFTLKAGDNNAKITVPTPMPSGAENGELKAYATKDNHGVAVFGEITYEEVGVYNYTIQETNDGVDGVTYDTTEYPVIVTVSKNEEGKKVTDVKYMVKGKEESALTIKNTFTSVKKNFEVTKEFERWDLADSFTFKLEAGNSSLVDDEGTVIKSPMPAAGGETAIATKAQPQAKFGEIAFEKVGTYNYTITEVNGGADGVSYDTVKNDEGAYVPKTHNVVVTVTKAKDTTNALTATVTYDGGESLTVTNTFTAVNEHLEVTKQLIGREWSDADAFEFTLEAGDSSLVDAEGKAVKSPMPAAGGEKATATKTLKTAKFGDITFEKAGTYNYTITETGKEGDGINYDTKTYTATVTVTKAEDASNKLTPRVTYGTENSLTITNEYNSVGGIEFDVTKKLVGRPISISVDGKERFGFGLYVYRPVLKLRGSNNDNGLNSDWHLVDYVYCDNTGKATFSYKDEDEKFTDVLTFTQKDITDWNDDGTGTGTKVFKVAEFIPDDAVNADGVKYKDADAEQRDAGGFKKDGYTYDSSVKTVTVNLEDNGEGHIDAEVVKEDSDELEFTNTYAAKGEIVLHAQKKLSGARKLEEGQFTFELIEVIEKDDSEVENVIDTKKNDAKGTVTFDPIKYTQDVIYEKNAGGVYSGSGEKEFTYKIREVIPEGAVDNGDGTYFFEGYTYDGNVYTIKVTATDNGDGTITAVDAADKATDGQKPTEEKYVFVNAYDAVGGLKLNAEKTYKNGTLRGGEFTFELRDADGKVLQSRKNDAAGHVYFEPLDYELEDAAKSPFTYTVREVPGSRTDVKYDATVYTVTVSLEDNGDGTLKVTKKIDNGGALKFVNEQLNVETSVTIGGEKVLKGGTLKNGQFKFVLADANGKWVDTATNDAEGNFTFKPITYKLSDLNGEKAKVFTYGVSEVKGSESRITYDEKVYTVKVTVTDNGDGTMTAKADLAKSDIKFVNREEKKKKDNTKTGDEASLGVLFGGLGIGAAGLAVLLEDRKRRNRNK